jgi:hypothetical protein
VACAKDDRPIFVVGCPRSGTTLLQVMLHSHPRIAIAPETRFLLPAYRQRLRFGDLEERPNRLALGKFITGRGHLFDNLGLDRKAIVSRIADGPPTLGSAIGTVLLAYAERFARPRWGEKRPGYFRHIDVLMRVFPGAQIIHIVRDPRDCVASLKRMPWWNRPTTIPSRRGRNRSITRTRPSADGRAPSRAFNTSGSSPIPSRTSQPFVPLSGRTTIPRWLSPSG